MLDEGYARLAFVWQVAPQWRLRLNTMLDKADQGGYPYARWDVATNTVSPISYNRRSSYERLISSTGFNAHYADHRLAFDAQTALQLVDDDQRIDQDFSADDRLVVTNQVNQLLLSQEFTLKSNHRGPYQWIVGAMGMHQRIDNTVNTQYLAQKLERPATAHLPTSALAVYHQSSYNFWRGLSATAGLRFDFERASNTYRKVNYSTATPNQQTVLSEFDHQLSFHQFTPRFGLQYLTDAQQLFYATVTRGYKAGGFNATFRNEAEQTYDPEYNWNYEIGAKLHFLRRRLTAEMAVFFIDWRQQQVVFTVPGQGNVLLNAGHSTSKGAELALTAQPLPQWNIQASYGYTLAQFVDYQKDATTNYADRYLPLVPRHTLGIESTYTHKLRRGWIDQLRLNVGAQGVGRIYWTEDNEASQPFYALLHAKLTADMGPFSLAIWGKNLTQTQYNVYAYKSGSYFAQLGRPLTFGASLTWNL